MWFLYLLSWIATLIHILFATLAIAAGLYYLAELVEEFSVITAKIIRIAILSLLVAYVGLLLFEDLPASMLFCGIFSQFTHLFILRTFPYFQFTSPSFILSLGMIIVNHYLAFTHFTTHYYPFYEVLAYFTLFLWLVPFTFFVSLSANDYVLPTIAERTPLLSDDSDVVSHYFSRQGKKYGLLSFFQYTKEAILPQRSKKAF